MAMWTAWWRRAGGVLAAVVLSVMLFAPVAEAAACSGEPPAAPSAVISDDGAANALADADGCGGACEEGCVHGHCHHLTAHGALTAAELGRRTVVAARHATGAASAPAFDLAFGLKRPPRA